MNQNTAQKDQSFDSDRKPALADDSSGGSATLSYGRILRTLGIILEQRGFHDFDLRIENEICIVNGIVERGPLKPLSLLEQVRSLLSGTPQSSAENGKTIELELSYSMAEIDALETQVQERRQGPSKMPDPCCLSQILRGVGCYLDKRIGSELLGLVKTGRWVTITYRASDGRLERTHQDFEYFYDYSVKMYMHRSGRETLPSLSDPTLIVTWEDRQKSHRLSQFSK